MRGARSKEATISPECGKPRPQGFSREEIMAASSSWNLARCIRNIVLAIEENRPPPRSVPRPLDDVLAEKPETTITSASRKAVLDKACRNLPFNREALLSYCAAQPDIRSVAFFGSILREDFLDSSDVDLLLDCGDSIASDWTEGFKKIFGRKVDALSVKDWGRVRNPVRKALIGNSKRTFYAR